MLLASCLTTVCELYDPSVSILAVALRVSPCSGVISGTIPPILTERKGPFALEVDQHHSAHHLELVPSPLTLTLHFRDIIWGVPLNPMLFHFWV